MSFPTRRIRTAKDANRRTLQPSVRDFSVQVIGRYADEENLYISTICGAQSEGALSRPQSSFTRSTVTYATLETFAQSHLPATFDTPRAASISPDEVHKRHVARSARLRSRLSGNKQLRLLDVQGRQSAPPWQDANPGFYIVDRPASGKTSQSPRSTRMSEFLGHQGSPRPRPATTGRYFDASNGLQPSSISRASMRLLNRQHSYPAWVGPGLLIQKMHLTPKDN